MPSVSVKDLSVTYNKGRTIALDNIDLNIEDGEFCVFLGPSGCGKTTALMCIAGLIVPDTGSIHIGDELVTDMATKTFVRPEDRNVAMVFQEYALYPNMTVRGNMSFALENRKYSKADIDSRIQDVSTMLGIESLLKRKPAELSGGQRQRVALGRALVRDPSLFLLDEPLGNLDAKLREQVRFDLKRIQRQLGVTTIYVTHDQIEAMTLADRIILMWDGEVMQEGTSDDLYLTPKNTFVAEFVGTPKINFIESRLGTKNGRPGFINGDIFLPCPKKLAGELSPEGDYVIGIRPGHFELAAEGDQDALECSVELIEPLGDDILVHFRIGKSLYAAMLEAEYKHQIEDKIALKVNPEHLHVFDAKTRERLN